VLEDAYPVEARRLPEQRQLRLTWNDGHQGEYDYDLLRGWCPCALCQGHQVTEVAFHPPAAPVEPRSIQPVGNYGLSFVWSDGHGTGIYRFDYLRHLCPCAACRAAGGGGHGQGGDPDVDSSTGGDDGPG
jgi:DUF971 family protein